MATPDPTALADLLRTITAQYATANQGSDEHALGHATVGTLQEVLPQAAHFPGVVAGYAIRFKDGSTYLVNVHLIPATQPPASKEPPQGASKK
jgi:hypothetical protein